MKRTYFQVLAVVACLLAFGLLSGCRKSQPAPSDVADAAELADDTVAVPMAADRLFDDFFFNFSTNERLQRQRIHFPLPVFDAEGTRMQIERSEWNVDPFFMEDGLYTLIFDNPAQMEAARDTSLTKAVVERINLDAGFVSQYDFEREDGCWMLTTIRHQLMKDNHNASFLDFYQRFSTDSLFQVQSLNHRVTFTTVDPDDELETISGTMEPGQWDTFRPSIVPSNTIYNIVYGEPLPEGRDKLFVIHGIADEEETQLTFSLRQNKWKLMSFSN